MSLSIKAKEAIKTALAMTLAYGISLQLDWEKPMWAGFAVAFVSLTTFGQSLNKAGMRMLGTLVAAGFSLGILALAIQDRWLFIVVLSVYVAICTYMTCGTKLQYFWSVSGFVCVIICMGAGPDSVNAFETAVLRIKETSLGILIYSLVGMLIWPTSSGKKFEAAARQWIENQHGLFKTYLTHLKGASQAQDAQALRTQETQAQNQFHQLLDAAESDSPEIWGRRRAWRRCQIEAGRLTETLERWREDFGELQGLDLSRLLPGLAEFTRELGERWIGTLRMLDGQEPDRHPAPADLPMDEDAVPGLTHFQRAALVVMRRRLQDLEAQTHALFESVSEARGFSSAKRNAPSSATPKVSFTLDPDRLVSSLRVLVIMWLTYLALIYVNGLPGGGSLLSLAAALGLVMAPKPQISVSMLFRPATISLLLASFVYLFVMPHLASFWGLGSLIFLVTFAICYLYAAPRQVAGRALGLALFASIASVTNQQTYSFMVVATTALMFALVFLILTITAYFPFSPHPERAFMRLLCRFFHSSRCMVESLHDEGQLGWPRLARMRRTFHACEVSSLPGKLAVWSRFINAKLFPGMAPSSVPALLVSLQALRSRIQAWCEIGRSPQAQPFIMELKSDIHAWQHKVLELLQRLSTDPGAAETDRLRTGLSERMERLELRLKERLDEADPERLGPDCGEEFYRLLGAFRGVSEVLVQYARDAEAINWAAWKEERF